jgi:hypothetical protein
MASSLTRRNITLSHMVGCWDRVFLEQNSTLNKHSVYAIK